MLTAIILVNATRGAVNETAEALVRLPGVAEVHSIAGKWDLAAIVKAETNQQLADLVTNRMLRLEGIQRTTTLVAFRTFTRAGASSDPSRSDAH